IKITYTFDRTLQRTMERYLEKNRSVQHAAFVAVEPATGRVLALVSYSRPRAARSRPAALRASFPAASIFKIITVAAALQEKKISPSTVVRFRGGYWSMNRSVLTDNPRRDRNYLTVERALAKSCNHCFGKIATRFVGTEKLKAYANAFAFNYPFEFELPVETSRAQIPSDRYQLARTGAGFGKVFFSPLHAALVAATVANDGRMMEPTIIEKIEDRNGRLLYAPRPRAIARPLEASVARQINQMMVKTVLEGTSKRAFKGFSARHPHLRVAGKTGSLKGTDPPGHNYWFIGSAPADKPTIAVSALVIPKSGRRFKGNQVARRAFETYFK
ncbi:MAG: penicillin-binding transpeptidase domain-containing protein, partial [Myxococcota bacterium]